MMLKNLTALFLGFCVFSNLVYANTKPVNNNVKEFNKCMEECRTCPGRYQDCMNKYPVKGEG